MSRWVNRFRSSDKLSPHCGVREIRRAPVASVEDIFAIIGAPLPLPSRSESSNQSYQILVAAVVAFKDVDHTLDTVTGHREHYFGAEDATSFWKRGSLRNGSNIGSSRSNAG